MCHFFKHRVFSFKFENVSKLTKTKMKNGKYIAIMIIINLISLALCDTEVLNIRMKEHKYSDNDKNINPLNIIDNKSIEVIKTFNESEDAICETYGLNGLINNFYRVKISYLVEWYYLLHIYVY